MITIVDFVGVFVVTTVAVVILLLLHSVVPTHVPVVVVTLCLIGTFIGDYYHLLIDVLLFIVGDYIQFDCIWYIPILNISF